MEDYKKVTLIGVLLNIFLFIIKVIGGLISGSLAVMSDAFNSLTDIISYTSIYFAVVWSRKKADKEHPFGHHRAEPLAAVIVSIFAGILGFEILKTAFSHMVNEEQSIVGLPALIVLGITIVVKTGMSVYFNIKSKKLNSPAIHAACIDSRNDVLVSSIAFIGVLASVYKAKVFDDLAAIFIAVCIVYSGYKIGKENIDYLMGKSPPENLIKKIASVAKRIKGVTGLNDIRAHYVGNLIHIEIHIEVDKGLSTESSHKIGKMVQRAVEKSNNIDRAFIHIDPR
jgi:cation diffusion facilitator family transporter